MRERKIMKLRLWFLLLLAIILVCGANAWKSSLKLKQVHVEGNRIVGTNEIIQLMQVQPGTLLYHVDLASIQRNVLSHYYIKDVVVERNLPSTINVNITERIPIAIINYSETLYLDDEGIVLPRSVSKKLFDLPVISGIPEKENIAPGQKVLDSQVQEVVQLLLTMRLVSRELYYDISEIQVHTTGGIVLYSAENSVPIIFGQGEIAAKFIKLETFWIEYVRIRGAKNLSYVDLRFKDRIVAKWNSNSQLSNTL